MFPAAQWNYPPDMIYTIGHSDHDWQAFTALLARHEITAIADVRSSPYSGRFPQFDKSFLQTSLPRVNVKYLFLGRELGARRDEPECYIEGVARYDLIAKTSAFNEGLARVREAAKKDGVAL